MMKNPSLTRFFASILIGIVIFWNIQAALLFILNPEPYIPSFQLSGIAGKAVVQGFGILFIMWNVPYFFALLNPITHRISLIEAILMQGIGVIGESILRFSLPAEEIVLRATVNRFILFDATGLVILIVAFWLTSRKKAHSS